MKTDVPRSVCVSLLGLTVTACGLDTGATDSGEPGGPCGPTALVEEVVAEPDLAEVPEDRANLVLDLSGATAAPVRVTVRLDGDVALDVRTPAAAGCSHPPVFAHAYRVPEGPAEVVVTTDAGHRGSVTVPVTSSVGGASTRWVAIQPQDDVPLGLGVYAEEPAWG